LPGITLPRVPDDREHVYYLYTLRVAGRVAGPTLEMTLAGQPRSEHRFRQRLADRGIASVVYYLFRSTSSRSTLLWEAKPGDLRISERAAREVLSIPLYPELTPAQIERVAGRSEMRFATDRKNTLYFKFKGLENDAELHRRGNSAPVQQEHHAKEQGQSRS